MIMKILYSAKFALSFDKIGCGFNKQVLISISICKTLFKIENLRTTIANIFAL